ncbi:MAG: redox-regulated ATPase YchF [Salinispira sp.]
MPLNCGIVGLPNVGKSTIFSALSASSVEAANYPFCTIEPNVGLVSVPDSRLNDIAGIIPTQKVIPAAVEFVDIAGLVKGASRGEGLGNKFLSHIREVGIIVHVVRCFENEDIIHVHERIDPAADIETVNIELALADLETVEKRLGRAEKELRAADRDSRAAAAKLVPILNDLKTLLQDGQPARKLQLEKEKAELIRDLHLISRKKVLYLCNVDEKTLRSGGAMDADADGDGDGAADGGAVGADGGGSAEHLRAVREIAEAEGAAVLTICGQLEKDIADLEDEQERREFLEDVGLSESGLTALIREGYRMLGLQTFFTAGEKEVRAWTFREGSTAPQAAGIIHSDFERGFIKAEVYHCSDLFERGSEQNIRNAGRLRMEGKDYTVHDGDVMHFKFNV